jgi:hypothetical protein
VVVGEIARFAKSSVKMLGAWQALEFDLNQFLDGMGFIWGHQKSSILFTQLQEG